jgi:uncharacterized Zn finger protein
MKASTLQELEKNISKLYLLVKDIELVWEDSLTSMVEVMLQNAASSSVKCINYSQERDEQYIINVNIVLKSLAKYHNYHFINWISKEYDMLVTGYIMSEDIEYSIEEKEQ